MNEQIFMAVLSGLVLSLFMWGYGFWQKFDWSEYFRENYLLPVFLFLCGVLTANMVGETFTTSLLLGFTLSLVITLLFGVRFQSEYALFKTKSSLNLQAIFGRSSNSNR